MHPAPYFTPPPPCARRTRIRRRPRARKRTYPAVLVTTDGRVLAQIENSIVNDRDETVRAETDALRAVSRAGGVPTQAAAPCTRAENPARQARAGPTPDRGARPASGGRGPVALRSLGHTKCGFAQKSHARFARRTKPGDWLLVRLRDQHTFQSAGALNGSGYSHVYDPSISRPHEHALQAGPRASARRHQAF